jgi:hypothetical protein
MSNEYKAKGASDAVIPDVFPQERVTGDILKGHGPRRGNLERLLRYWRPIMRKEGGFRRCRVILANHPELFPLERICAWLHHETTGLWPNEGCHHPGMKNCKGKLRKLISNDASFRKKLNNLDNVRIPGGKKSAMAEDDMDHFYSMHDHSKMGEDNPVVTEDDILHAMKVLSEFVEMEKGFADYLRDEKNWEIEGEDMNGNTKTLPFSSVERKSDCCG